ncbi:MBL fold metallo-hydrolase, partial [Dietzia cercidiphylli]
IHADYLSGTRELAAATGATVYVSGEGGDDWQYRFAAERLYHGDRLTLGNITVEAVHTPGHTPEHLSFLITDGAFADTPGYMLTGDFVFSGDLGRPDLLDEAAGGVDTRFAGAKQIFRSLKDSFVTLPDHVQVFPGHGSGSACGKALGALPSTSVGYERRYAWWAGYVNDDDEEGFVSELLDGQPDAHAYFGRMKRQNRQGPDVLGPLAPLRRYDSAEVADALETNEVVVVDTRGQDEVHAGTVPGSLNIPGVDKAASFGAWVYDPESEDTPLVVLARDVEMAEALRDHLLRVGIDTVTGYTTGLEGLPMTTPEMIGPDELDAFDAAMVLDVRNKTEHSEGHIPGSDQLSGGRLLWNLDRLPTDGPIVTYCQSGVRNSVAASALRRAGYHVVELEGSYAAWSERTLVSA